METNYPPIKESTELLLTDLPARLEAETHVMTLRRDALIASSGRVPPITTDEISGKVADLDEQLAKFIKAAKDWKDKSKEPVLVLDRAIMQQHANLVTTIVSTKDTINKMQTDYLRKKADAELAERRRIEQEARDAAEKLRLEAEQAAAALTKPEDLDAAVRAEEAATQAAITAQQASVAVAAKPSELGRVTSSFGSTQSLRKKWVHRSVDMATVDLELLRAYLTADDLDKAIKKAIKAERLQIKGVVIEEEYKAR